MVPARDRSPGANAPAEEIAMFFPGFIYSRRRWGRDASCGDVRWAAAHAAAACGPSVEQLGASGAEFTPGASFGVRRPLRFLAWKLDLDEKQTAELAKVLADMKTERAQAEVDARRAASLLADLASAAEFDEAKASAAADLKVKSAERIRDALVKLLARLHAILDPQQRERLAYLIRTGTLQL
jgi:Spy/CpxP family protein refolding chaperone